MWCGLYVRERVEILNLYNQVAIRVYFRFADLDYTLTGVCPA